MKPHPDLAPSCEVGVPGTVSPGPGWYLVARNGRAEAGPFATCDDARAAARWLDETSRGVNPAPWRPCYSPSALTIGTRTKRKPLAPPVAIG